MLSLYNYKTNNSSKKIKGGMNPMKKFISMVMTAAMVASLVPATAFAKSGDVAADVKVVKAWTEHRDSTSLPNVEGREVPEVRMTVTRAEQYDTSKVPETEVTLTLDNAKFDDSTAGISRLYNGIEIYDKNGNRINDGNNVNAATYTRTAIKNPLVAPSNVTDPAPTNDDAYNYIIAYLEGNNKGDAHLDATGNAGVDTASGTTVAAAVADAKDEQDVKDEEYKVSPADEAAKFISQNIDKMAPVYKENKALVAALANTTTNWEFKQNAVTSEEELVDSTNAYKILMKDVQRDLNRTSNSFKGEKNTPADYNRFVANQVLITATNAQGLFKDEPGSVNVNKPAAGSHGIIVGNGTITVEGVNTKNLVVNPGKDELTITLYGKFEVGDVISIDLPSVMNRKTSDAKVRVGGDITTSSDYMTYVSVQDKSIKASVKKVVKIAEEEHDTIDADGVTIEGVVAESFRAGSKVVLRLPRGFEFRDDMKLALKDFDVTGGTADVAIPNVHIDGNEAEFTIPADASNVKLIDDDKMVLRGIEVDVDTAKTGAKATLSIKIDNLPKVEVDIAEVVDYKVVMSVNKDKEVPVYYSMTDANDTGLTSNDNHESLEITLEETFPGAWSMRKGFDITLPEGVFVTDVRVTNTENFNRTPKGAAATKVEATKADWEKAFAKAYQDGDHLKFEFEKRVFDDVNNQLEKDPAKMSFILTLVADYDFGGTPDKPAEVKIGFDGELVDKQEVVVAKFVKPYTVEAEQNDLKIDARQTKLDKNIVVKETADGLWDKNTEFVFNVEKDLIKFEDDAKFAVDKDSELAINDHSKRNELSFDVKTVGNKKGTVTISDIALFMERNIPQGEYALELTGTLRDALHNQRLYAPDDAKVLVGDVKTDSKFNGVKLTGDNFVDDVARDKDEVVSKKFINVITARRDEDGFTTRIAVPVGETYIFAGVDKLEGAENSMEVPAYINKDNYTMLPLRAVARALGIANGNIYWNQATQTATVQYGNSRIMTFKLGAKEMIINGHSMPAVAGIEMTNNRLFLSLRDLGVAMNVPAEKIAWDSKTKTAYLNPTAEDMAAIKG